MSRSDVCWRSADGTFEFARVPTAGLADWLGKEAGERRVGVAIDAPHRAGSNPTMRVAERRLLDLGIKSYFTKPDDGSKQFGWMTSGFHVYERLWASGFVHQPADTAGVDSWTIEAYPHATAVVTLGHLYPSLHKGLARLAAVQALGGAPDPTWSGHRVDACLALLTAEAFEANAAGAVGEVEEGQIVLPAAPSPDKYRQATAQQLRSILRDLGSDDR